MGLWCQVVHDAVIADIHGFGIRGPHWGTVESTLDVSI